MFVKLLIGRNAGAIVDMRLDAAQAGIANGTCEKPTDEEMAAANIPVQRGSGAEPEAMPEGYTSKPNEEAGGFDVFGPDGTQINVEPLRNLAQARDLARQHAESAQGPAGIPDGWQDLAWPDLRALAQAIAPDLKSNPSKADCVAAIEAEVAKRAAAEQPAA